VARLFEPVVAALRALMHSLALLLLPRSSPQNGVGVGVGVTAGVGVGVGDEGVGVGVAGIGVGVMVGCGVSVGLGVGVGLGVRVGSGLGAACAFIEKANIAKAIASGTLKREVNNRRPLKFCREGFFIVVTYTMATANAIFLF
jgi:hypothetical protein